MGLKESIQKLKKSTLAKDAGIYTIFRVVDKFIPFLLLPIITRELDPSEYGVFVLFQALAGIALPLITLSVDSSILLNYFKVKKEEFSSYFSSGYVMLIGSSLAFGGILYVLRNPISDITEFPASWIISIIVFCFFQLHTSLALNMYQVKRQPKKYGIFSISLTATKNLSMLFFVIVLGWKWQGIIVGYLLSYALFFLISLYFFSIHNLYSTVIRKDFIVDNIKVGYPLSLHRIGSWLADSATRIIIGGILGTAATGSFGIGATIGLIVKYTQDSFNKAFVPYLFEKLNNFNQEIENKIVKLTYGYNFSLLLFSSITGFLGLLLIEPVFGTAYSEGKEVVLLLCLASAFDGMYKMHVNYIFYSKKTHLILIITLTTGTLNIILSYLFVEWYGLKGGALSLLIINVVGYLISWYMGNKVFPMSWFKFSK
ncbi:oligosaccharide flippase family protein [Gracilimonas sp.]|uniref:lipopolysaccharide biosynthesis protein n=1 Tax=Gracilimonas sp. TaxID=1974203 RepID=UPI0032EE520F